MWNSSSVKCGNDSPSKKAVGQIDLGRFGKCEAAKNGRQLATRDAIQGGTRPFCGTALTFASEACSCVKAYNAGKSDDWANYLEVFVGNGNLSAWTSAKVEECWRREQGKGSRVLQQTSLFNRFLGPNLCGGYFAASSYADVESVGQFL